LAIANDITADRLRAVTESTLAAKAIGRSPTQPRPTFWSSIR
jgi:hypothetical protein